MGARRIQCLIFLLGFLCCSALEEHASLQSANAMPEMDVITPIATVPVVNPTATTTTTPVYNPFPTMTPYSTPASSSSSGQSWCVASQTASQASLQVALDYACGYGGADCSSIQKGGGCFDPDTMRDHASYAFNDYYQRKPNPTSCDFAGTAIITSVDPSTSTCHYQSTSTSSSVLNTRYPYGSNVYGSSVPPTTSSSISISNGRSLLHISLIFITLSLNSFAEQGIQ
ncbi:PLASMODESMATA CALLOSE-BINDING PROTEIN 3-like [Zingiber officinale]|uniref:PLASMODESMATA CALLOSE-BINDING PROTEIN 3-like n=1 Tax=Zingiber officinale TaxID=94328 RepID=UPI001C4DAB7B|nr:PLASMODESMATA CALLOSE-BINDING PROTEIN 3-like [Zingiber officinale]XP_042383364.1 PLASMODESMATA CALLOSE-BINDING PROTEIN 3-like [Zingiber officinale]XP_042383365.1 PLASMODESMATA CALLOSE-BINDING PROTEIN 3-like [Zingiber officinale]XP_042383366.1 PLASMODESMATA CALLOSE-BINDING PROTEIN 3-like [Zingiber officinale]XP_042383367.1 PLASMODESMATA CALLOSE-BINDING PROTEIN 3-like [Zingiber officinale]XP_042383368.1 PLASMODESMATA CALLOSE-BINDING PROTEIN 3-like [Zingiber officinale]XP_042383369.1 PLASMODE